MIFIKKLFSNNDRKEEKDPKAKEKFDPTSEPVKSKPSTKPSGSGSINKPGSPLNPIPVPKDPTIKDK